MEKIEKCDRCLRDFIRKYVAPQRSWSQLNEVSFWTEGKSWKGYEILCRACLKDWRKSHPDDFLRLVGEEKKSRFRAYLYNGLLDKNDLVSKK
ncbi:hypothetical protein [endosymbiont GvMRE of Glomus versiforme]|uniref:hypothetical protein n=1 Tax=endosymbiont GvMRE of Glomus versiforme TaxID=2039283 RepID=UPI000ECAB21C|nr:hypothetical protein [endosymbiont GvMRE of Glomus versiforme]RHZ36501.1 hypothetical protein GvMRE_I2g212 [endosymbiont GvMRE of Glomus versiforme]